MGRDFSISGKSSSSLKFKDLDKHNRDRSSESGKPVYDSTELIYTNNRPVEGKDFVGMEIKDEHPDTVAQLKKRSEQVLGSTGFRGQTRATTPGGTDTLAFSNASHKPRNIFHLIKRPNVIEIQLLIKTNK
ncbi:hypothetical protein VNO80_22113 [Phaseolus coccineus]|uniref:Uncharacterized protein n=1 Tax=Phaseolus coccineus TaxID=3886 RepID=A0AAN9M9C3_PHACN